MVPALRVCTPATPKPATAASDPPNYQTLTKTPLASPLFASLSGLPPLLVLVGTAE